MPELPEVEIARRNLSKWLVGATITSASFSAPRIIRPAAPRTLERAVTSRKVLAVTRRGKWLRIALDDGALIFSHLGMSGKWVMAALDASDRKHERARMLAAKGKKQHRVSYVDPRMFGRIVAARQDIPEWTELGPDPLNDGIDLEVLATALHAVRRTVKEAIMDQTLLAGIGNIHATEALWRARLDPRSRTDALTLVDVRALAHGMEASIQETLVKEDGPEVTYVEEPGAPNPFAIYGHEGDPCPRCGRPLTRIVLGGRSTFFCAKCQRLRK